MSNYLRKKTTFTVILIMATNLAVKFFGLLRESLIAKYYGTTIYTDSYIIANNIPTVLFAAFGASLSTTFIPMYSRVKKERGEIRADSFTIHLVIAIMFICAILTIVCEIFTKEVVKLFAAGFTEIQMQITISFARILLPSIFGLALMNIMGSYLQLHDKFLPISLVPMMGNILIILTLVYSNNSGNIYIFVWGTLIGLVVQVLFYTPWIAGKNLFSAPMDGFAKDNYIKQLLPLIMPVFIGEAVNEINSIVDRSLVSGLAVGSVSYLNYSYKVINLIIGVVVISLLTIIYPKIANIYAQDKKELFNACCSSALSVIITCVAPVMMLVVFFKEDIIRILFQRGNFDAISTDMTATALGCYAIGLIAMGIRELCAKIFYSMQDTRTPMRSGMICAGTNIVLDIVLISILGFKGAAIATAAAACIGALILLVKLSQMQVLKIGNICLLLFKCLLGVSIGHIFLSMWKTLAINSGEFNLMYYMLCVVGAILSCFLYLGAQILLKNSVLNSLLLFKSTK